MSNTSPAKPLLLLVDDDLKSARQLTDLCNRSGLVRLRWVGDAPQAMSVLSGETGAERPHLIIVDLKSAPDATSAFIRDASEHALVEGVPIGLFGRVPRQHPSTQDKTIMLDRPGPELDENTEIQRVVRTWLREAQQTES